MWGSFLFLSEDSYCVVVEEVLDGVLSKVAKQSRLTLSHQGLGADEPRVEAKERRSLSLIQ